MAGIDDPRDTPYWLRQVNELADEAGSTASEQMRTRQAKFLANFVTTGALTIAAGAAGVTRHTTDRWAKEDPIFFEARAMAFDAYSDLLIAEATRRAVEGLEIIVRDRHGNVVGDERKYSDDLIKFLLKGLDTKARWAQRAEAGGAREGAWRADLAKILANPESRAALEALADTMSAG